MKGYKIGDRYEETSIKVTEDMTRLQFIKFAEGVLRRSLIGYRVELRADPDDYSTFFAYIFGVPDMMRTAVKDCARSIIRRELSNYTWAVIPALRKREHDGY